MFFLQLTSIIGSELVEGFPAFILRSCVISSICENKLVEHFTVFILHSGAICSTFEKDTQDCVKTSEAW